VIVDGDYPHIAAAYRTAGAVVGAALAEDPEKAQEPEGSEADLKSLKVPELKALAEDPEKAQEPEGSEADLKSLKVPELKALAEEQGIEFAANATKAQLIELLSVDVENEPSEGS